METKTCSKCNETLPVNRFNKSKTRKDGLDPYCKDCKSKQSKEVYQKRRDAKLERAKQYRLETDYDKNYYQVNRERKLEYEKLKPRKTGRRIGQIQSITERKVKVNQEKKCSKDLCVGYLGGKCSVCGYDKCSAALEFHHTDPTKKDFNIGNKIKTSKAFEKWKSELDKCILVCSNCHREIHASSLILGQISLQGDSHTAMQQLPISF